MLKFLVLAGVLGLGACGPRTDEVFEKEAEATAAKLEVSKGIVGQDTLPDWVNIITDQDTGCQYLISNNGGLVKREGVACPTKNL